MTDEQRDRPGEDDEELPASTDDEDAEGQALTWKVRRKPPVEEPDDADGHAVRPPPETYDPDR